MIECVITLDYEIYGNGRGSLREQVYEPAERLSAICRKRNCRFVVFVEVAELEAIEAAQVDPYVEDVKRQVRSLLEEGFEVGLHIHPWWYNSSYRDGAWVLDYSEYNLCTLPQERIAAIIDRSIAYLRSILKKPDSSPISYRSGHLLFQPTSTVARVLAQRGIKIDSSVYNGGLWRYQKQDYRKTQNNGYYWRFSDEVVVPDSQGGLLEVPIYTQMVPVWKMLTGKRIGLQQKVVSAPVSQSSVRLPRRILDRARFFHPSKMDFCSMTIAELTRMVDSVILEDKRSPSIYRPIVAIGHTKDLVDLETVDQFLAYLGENGIGVSTFEQMYRSRVCGLSEHQMGAEAR
jgi:hypothetical protein